MAETLLNEIGKDRFRAYGAGSRPAGTVNPYTRELLERNGHPTDHLRSKGVSLPLRSLDRMAMEHGLRGIGRASA